SGWISKPRPYRASGKATRASARKAPRPHVGSTTDAGRNPVAEIKRHAARANGAGVWKSPYSSCLAVFVLAIGSGTDAVNAGSYGRPPQSLGDIAAAIAARSRSLSSRFRAAG